MLGKHHTVTENRATINALGNTWASSVRAPLLNYGAIPQILIVIQSCLHRLSAGQTANFPLHACFILCNLFKMRHNTNEYQHVVAITSPFNPLNVVLSCLL